MASTTAALAASRNGIGIEREPEHQGGERHGAEHAAQQPAVAGADLTAPRRHAQESQAADGPLQQEGGAVEPDHGESPYTADPDGPNPADLNHRQAGTILPGGPKWTDPPIPAIHPVPESARRVLLVCSTGGHLAQMYRLRPWWDRHERVWVTFRRPDAQSLLAGEQTIWAYEPTTRNLRNLVRNTFLTIQVLRRVRPEVIVSNGAGVAVPFFVLGRLPRLSYRLHRGVRSDLQLDHDRTHVPALHRPVLRPVARAAALLPRVRRRGTAPVIALVEPDVEPDAAPRTSSCSWAPTTTRSPGWWSGSTAGRPRTRTSRASSSTDPRRPPVTRKGTAYVEHRGAPRDRLDRRRDRRPRAARARSSTRSEAGRVPVVLPRLARLGEVVDDHQVAFGRLMHERGRAVCVEDEEALAAAIDACAGPPRGGAQRRRRTRPAPTITLIGDLIDGLLARSTPTVLYLGGAGRSGSTLLERMLGQLPDVVAVGEIVHLVRRGLLDDEDCGCGCPFSVCPFWTKVGEHAFGGLAHRRRGAALGSRPARRRPQPRRAGPRDRRVGAFRAALARHTERLGSLYRAVAEVSGARVIVDSSKHVSTALVLRRTAGVDLHVVHLVRDSRGVAHSWTKEVERPETRRRRDHAPLPPGLGRRLVGLVQPRLRRGRPARRADHGAALRGPARRPPHRTRRDLARTGRRPDDGDALALPDRRHRPTRLRPLGGRQPDAVPDRHPPPQAATRRGGPSSAPRFAAHRHRGHRAAAGPVRRTSSRTRAAP